MALFGRKKKEISPGEMQAKEENRSKLDAFQMTKAWGVKKYASAMQFIYDKDARQFVVVEGPEETFKDREPWVIDFDQVVSVALDVEENWSEEKGEYAPDGRGVLLQERYDEVWWKYDFYIIVETTHPYAKTIRFQTNFKSNKLQVPQRGIFVRRGLEMHGKYQGTKLEELVEKLQKLTEEEPVAIKKKQTFDLFTGNRPDSVKGRLIEDFNNDAYLKTLNNILTHVQRAQRISQLVLK